MNKTSTVDHCYPSAKTQVTVANCRSKSAAILEDIQSGIWILFAIPIFCQSYQEMLEPFPLNNYQNMVISEGRAEADRIDDGSLVPL